MKKIIILDAGHSLNDPGAVANNTTESQEAIKIRDKLIPLLENDFEVAMVPDDLNLIKSIEWVNNRYKNLDDGLALAIHLNAGGGYGAETLYFEGEEKSRKIAQTIIDKYCSLTRFRNRGAKPDTDTRHKRLGWIRDIKPWSCLIECCFVDNEEEVKKFQEEYNEIAWALYSAICEVYGIKPTEPKKNKIEPTQPVEESNIKEQIKTKANELMDLIKQL
ncbi:MAG: N-acetylmuramoyl-L-alanine amidase [Patescibacteria group bacterium]